MRSAVRVATIRVSPDTSGGGFVLTGDRVDLVVIFGVLDVDDISGGATQCVVGETVPQGIRVLADDREVATERSRRGEKRWVDAGLSGMLAVSTRCRCRMTRRGIGCGNAAPSA
ncbi:MAG: hypothetical protein GDA49_10265 [Rhodospirillales bacterium]|nr:hypothetical protein [Rhodospirillales bacterium]